MKKIHNLHILLEMCESVDEKFKKLKENCLFLNAFYIDTRYPAFWPVGKSRKEADKAQKLAKEIGDFVKKKIDPKLLSLTREFADKEIAEWEKEDKDNS